LPSQLVGDKPCLSENGVSENCLSRNALRERCYAERRDWVVPNRRHCPVVADLKKRFESFLTDRFCHAAGKLCVCLYTATSYELMLKCSYFSKLYVPKVMSTSEKSMVFRRIHISVAGLPLFWGLLGRFFPFYRGDIHRAPSGRCDSLMQDLQKNPDMNVVMCVPCVAVCSRTGLRIGSGHGYYDRYFAKLQHNGLFERVLKVGVVWDKHIFAGDETEESLKGALCAKLWDVPMDVILSERRFMTLPTSSS